MVPSTNLAWGSWLNIVCQVNTEPFFHFGNISAFSRCIVFDLGKIKTFFKERTTWSLDATHLIFRNFSDGEITRLGMSKHESRNWSCWLHSQGIRQPDACPRFGLQQTPHGQLLCVVRLARITRSRTDTLLDNRRWVRHALTPSFGTHYFIFDAVQISSC